MLVCFFSLQPAKPAEPNPVTVAMEALLRKELAVLSERLSRATSECATLRGERDELYQVGGGSTRAAK